MKKRISHSLEETAIIAAEWLESISMTKDHDKATVIGLSGNLGAGKTAFVKCVAKTMGITEEVTSPTFVIMKIYDIAIHRGSTSMSRWKRLVHIDAYRLDKAQELEALKFEGLAADPANLILVEWPENVDLQKIVPRVQIITFEAGRGETERVLDFGIVKN